MTRRLTLHIGSHKTGTTSLQWTFLANREVLQSRGLSFVTGGSQPNLHAFVGLGPTRCLIPDGFRLRDHEALAAALAAAPGPEVFASSENLSFFFQAEAIAELAALVRPHFSQIRILCYLRRQDRHAVSHHQEGAKPARAPAGELWGHATVALPAAHPRHALYLDYDRRIGHWADAFGEEALIARVFDRSSLKDGDLVADALQALGIASQGLQPIADLNTSLGAVQSWVGHKMNAADVPEAFAGAVLQSLPKGRGPCLPGLRRGPSTSPTARAMPG